MARHSASATDRRHFSRYVARQVVVDVSRIDPLHGDNSWGRVDVDDDGYYLLLRESPSIWIPFETNGDRRTPVDTIGSRGSVACGFRFQ